MIRKILIANRGEIALRIIRTCREMGITAAAIYNKNDETSLHAIAADEAYFLGEGDISSTYLNIQRIIEIAKAAGADAIHPGYGFLSENASFIEAVRKSGLGFIGPSAESVRAMGEKTNAREVVSKAGVPVVPGSDGVIKTVEELHEKAAQIGFPVLLKATAGGGGKGMKKVFHPEELEDAFNSATREAIKFFGNGAVYLEKLIEKPKHIEVQILADKMGNTVHLFERECSLQRRHQKVIEEAPSPSITPDLREKMTTVAVNAAKAVNYFGAGTIEMLLDKHGSFYFLEMNTRIQVEHPVTEMITGIDLVREQILIEEGKELSFRQDEILFRGHAIECRIYAEDPDNEFLPATGKLTTLVFPSGPGIRIDEGVTENSVITTAFDPMIAKLTVHAADRPKAISRGIRALNELVLAGCGNNLEFLKKLFRFPEFVNGSHTINSIEESMNAIQSLRPEKGVSDEIFAAALAVIESSVRNDSGQREATEAETSNWRRQLYED
ncbi:MAG: acetyl-CoA carboxylase biotin carboxylase subunit [Ignavibacteriaceae bacterium]|nr:acetyl-CoA carboxylase biotin carboxylase subunit [Ignavibacteriaceae bacterium]